MLRKSLFIIAFAAALLPSCHREKADTLRTGDLVFVGIPMGYSLDEGSMDEAITSSTGAPEGLNLIHVAIADVDREGSWIIDATIKRGIDRHPLDTFKTDFTLKDGSLPTFIVMRLKDPSKASDYVENCKRFLGLPYDMHFMPDNDSLYCSELVRDSYVDSDGNHIFDSEPMNFKDAEGEFPLYWRQLFELLHAPIPQGIPGTNPQSMSQSPALETVNVNIERI